MIVDKEFKSLIQQTIQIHNSNASDPVNLALPSTISSSKKKDMTADPKPRKKKSSPKNGNGSSTVPIPDSFSASKNPNLKKLVGRSRLVDISMLPKLRIVKKDFRRRYIEMYNNVMNNHDADLLHRFLFEFCTPDCQFIINVGLSFSPPVKQGILDIVRYTMLTAIRMPDNCHYLTNARIHVPLDQPGSRIVSTVNFKGTVLFELHPDQAKAFAPSRDSSPSFPSFSSYSSSNHTSPRAITPAQSVEIDKSFVFGSEDFDKAESGLKLPSAILPDFQSLQLLPVSMPQEVTVLGMFTMQLDDSNRIEKFIVETHHMSTKIITYLWQSSPVLVFLLSFSWHRHRLCINPFSLLTLF